MAHFYAEVFSNRKPVTKAGYKTTGIKAHVRGWHVGALVEIDHINGEDVVRVYSTKGSSDQGKPAKLLAEFVAGGRRK